MKKLITSIVCLVSLSSFAQNHESEFKSASWKAPYKLTTPNGWSEERSLLANKISYHGVEDLRLAPGWNDAKSDGYWTYASLWTMNGSHKTNEETIEKNLISYFTAKQSKSTEKGKNSTKKNSPVKAWVTELNNEKGDLKTYFGTIAMHGFKEQAPISLHCFIHVRSCPGQNKTFIFYEFSPKPLNDIIWTGLDQLWSDFDFIPYQPYSSN